MMAKPSALFFVGLASTSKILGLVAGQGFTRCAHPKDLHSIYTASQQALIVLSNEGSRSAVWIATAS